jgi:hypothetical protein
MTHYPSVQELEQINNSIKNLQIFLKKRAEKAKLSSDKKPDDLKLKGNFVEFTNQYDLLNKMLTLIIKLWDENEILKAALTDLGDSEWDELIWEAPPTPPKNFN